jgi:hypothetical protein
LIGPQKGSTQPSDNTWEGTFDKHTESYYSNGTLSTLYVKNLPQNTTTPSYYPTSMVNGVTGGILYSALTVTPVSSSYSSGQSCDAREMSADSLENAFNEEQMELFRMIAMDEITFSQYDEQARWMNKYNLLNLMRDNSNLTDNADLAAFNAAGSSNNLHQLMNVNDLITAGGYTAANTLLPGINPENEVEENLITVYSIEANKAGATYSAEQLLVLETVANLCPYSAGYAVYNARTILRSLDPDLEYSNACETVSRKYAPGAIQKNSTLKLYPNPANNLLNIELSEGTGILTIYNVIGESVMNIKITALNTSIALEHIPAGIYTYKLNGNNQSINSGKLVIIK